MKKTITIIKDGEKVEYTVPDLNDRVLVDLCAESKCNARCDECIVMELARQIGMEYVFG